MLCLFKKKLSLFKILKSCSRCKIIIQETINSDLTPSKNEGVIFISVIPYNFVIDIEFVNLKNEAL